MQFLAARSLWTNLLAFRYDMPSAISPAIWIIFLSGGKTWLVEFCGRVRREWGERVKKHSPLVIFLCFPQHKALVRVQHYNVRNGCCVWLCAHGCGRKTAKKRGRACVCGWHFTPWPISVRDWQHLLQGRSVFVIVRVCVRKSCLLLSAESAGSSWDLHGSLAP